MTEQAHGRPGARVMVLAGHGRYEDPWHDTAATSHRVAELLTADGHDVTVRGTFPDALADLHPDAVDLVVVNSGSGRVDPAFDGDDDAWAPFHAALAAWVGAGGPVLALHQAANTFGDDPRWEAVLGGRWVDGLSMHPPIGDAVFRVAASAGEHPVVTGLGSGVTAFDERYSYLRTAPEVQVLLTQEHDDREHAVVWVREADGVRVVYDALGHDVRSYASPSRVTLLRNEVAWLLRR